MFEKYDLELFLHEYPIVDIMVWHYYLNGGYTGIGLKYQSLLPFNILFLCFLSNMWKCIFELHLDMRLNLPGYLSRCESPVQDHFYFLRFCQLKYGLPFSLPFLNTPNRSLVSIREPHLNVFLGQPIISCPFIPG